MPEERPDAQSQIDECVAKLKSKIPPMEHGALRKLKALASFNCDTLPSVQRIVDGLLVKTAIVLAIASGPLPNVIERSGL
jgi:hypothetical protein